VRPIARGILLEKYVTSGIVDCLGGLGGSFGDIEGKSEYGGGAILLELIIGLLNAGSVL
jgi:hypothetical protein